MQAPHGHDHAADATGDGAASEQAAMMESLHGHPFADPQFLQALTVNIRQGVPVDAVYGSWLTKW